MVPDDYTVGDFSKWTALDMAELIVKGMDRFEEVPPELKQYWIAMVIAAWMRDSVLGAMQRAGGNGNEIDLRSMWD